MPVGARGRYASGVAVGLVVTFGPAASARAEPLVDACLRDSYAGQTAKNGGRLVEAMSALERCARDVCPAVIRDDCARFYEEARSATPTVVFSAVDERGRDVFDVRVTVDEKPSAELDGRETPLDPGRHEVKFVRSSGAVVTLPLLARTGDKARPVVARFEAPPGPVATPPPARHVDVPPSPPPRALPVLPIVLAGVAVAAFGAAAYFQLSGTADVRELRDRCGERCPPDEAASLDRVRSQKEWAARIGAGVGVLSAAAAVWLFLTRSDDSAGNGRTPRGAALGFDLTPTLAKTTWTVRF